MKKILSIALAVVMVLSIASVAGALWEPTPADPATDYRVQISVEKYALETGYYGYNYTTAENITAANSAPVYYVVKMDIPASPNAEEKATVVSVNYKGIAGTDYKNSIATFYVTTADGSWAPKNNCTTWYYNGTDWNPGNATAFLTDPGSVVARANCYDTTTASIKVEASAKRDLKVDDGFEWKGYTVYYSGTAIAFVKDGQKVRFTLGSDGLASYQSSSATTSTFESNLFADLGFTAPELNADKIYMTETNLRNLFGFSYKVTDSVNWTATNYPIIVDTNVGIPKTGDNASVIGFAMIMVAVVAAAVAVRKVNA